MHVFTAFLWVNAFAISNHGLASASPLQEWCMFQYQFCQEALPPRTDSTCDARFRDCVKDAFATHGTPGFEYDCSGKVDGNYPHPTQCTHYVACVAQTEAYEMECAQNHDGKPLHYVRDSGPDPATSKCDYPEVAGCICRPNWCAYDCIDLGHYCDRKAQHSSQQLLTASEKGCEQLDVGKFCKDKSEGVYEDPKDCTKYVICEEEGGVAMSCPLGPGGVRFFFDKSLGECVWPEEAKCGAKCPKL